MERETSAQIWEGLTCTKCWCEAGSSVQSLQKASLAAETTGCRFLWHFGPKMTSEAISECLNFIGEHAPRPFYLVTHNLLVSHHIGPTNLKQLALALSERATLSQYLWHP